MDDINNVNKFELSLMDGRELTIKPEGYTPVKISWRDGKPYVITKDSYGIELMVFLREM